MLKRTNQRPKLRRLDKVLLAACSRILPRARWAIFSVEPSTLTRWHSELIRRKWTYKHKKAGRPPVNPELVKLICQMARDRTLRTYADHYNRNRPHRALGLATPEPVAKDPVPTRPRDVRRREILGGLINEYHGVAA